MERNRGFRLITPGAREIAEIFHLRLLLEVPMARIAAARRTPVRNRSLKERLNEMRRAGRLHDEALFMLHDREFHEEILRASGNQRLVATVGALRDTTRMLGASTVDRSRSLSDIADEHAPIARAIAAGDPDAAAARMAEHITHTGQLLVAQALRADGSPADPQGLWCEVVGEEPAR
jgi:DNA-binding GntR family transcriptional regulator